MSIKHVITIVRTMIFTHVGVLPPDLCLLGWGQPSKMALVPYDGAAAGGVFRGPSHQTRRRADPRVSVADLSRKIELWFAQRGCRDVNRLLRPLRLNGHTFKTAVSVEHYR